MTIIVFHSASASTYKEYTNKLMSTNQQQYTLLKKSGNFVIAQIKLFRFKTIIYTICHIFDTTICNICSSSHYCRILSDIVGYCQILSDIVRYCRILSDIVRYCQILSDIVRYCQILSDIVNIKVFQCCQTGFKGLLGVQNSLWLRAPKRSLGVFRKSRALCPSSGFLSVADMSLNVTKGDVKQ